MDGSQPRSAAQQCRFKKCSSKKDTLGVVTVRPHRARLDGEADWWARDDMSARRRRARLAGALFTNQNVRPKKSSWLSAGNPADSSRKAWGVLVVKQRSGDARSPVACLSPVE